MAISGLGVVYSVGGFVLLYSGWKGSTIQDTLTSFLKGTQPSRSSLYPAGGPSIGVNDANATTSSTAPSSGTAGDATASASQSSWIAAFLSDLGAPNNAQNQAVMVQWMKQEEPNFPPPNAWNPLNIESPGGGFEQYSSSTAGAQASAQWLLTNHYTGIVSLLKTSSLMCNTSAASEFSAFSGSGYNQVCAGQG